MLSGNKLILPKLGFNGSDESYSKKGGWGAFLIGVLLVLAFGSSGGMVYFGMLIPWSGSSPAGWLQPVICAYATTLPFLAIACILAYKVQMGYNVPLLRTLVIDKKKLLQKDRNLTTR